MSDEKKNTSESKSSVPQTQWQRRIPDHSITWSTNVQHKKENTACVASYYPGENPHIGKKKKSVNSTVPRNKRQSRG